MNLASYGEKIFLSISSKLSSHMLFSNLDNPRNVFISDIFSVLETMKPFFTGFPGALVQVFIHHWNLADWARALKHRICQCHTLRQKKSRTTVLSFFWVCKSNIVFFHDMETDPEKWTIQLFSQFQFTIRFCL